MIILSSLQNYRIFAIYTFIDSSMKTIRLTREFDFEMAHCLHNYDGACRQIHGHSYKLFVTVCGTPCCDELNPKLGMVMDFGELKSIVNHLIVDRYDHTLVMRRVDEDQLLVEAMRQKWSRIELTDYQPTCENMILDFAQLLQKALPSKVRLVKLKLYETARSYAEWRIEDNQ